MELIGVRTHIIEFSSRIGGKRERQNYRVFLRDVVNKQCYMVEATNWYGDSAFGDLDSSTGSLYGPTLIDERHIGPLHYVLLPEAAHLRFRVKPDCPCEWFDHKIIESVNPTNDKVVSLLTSTEAQQSGGGSTLNTDILKETNRLGKFALHLTGY